MFDRALLREPFDKLFKRAVTEIGYRPENKDHDIQIIKETVTRLLGELITNKFNELRARGDQSKEYFDKREEKARQIVLEFLGKRIRKLIRSNKA